MRLNTNDYLKTINYKKMKKIKITGSSLCLLLLIIFSSCSKIDDYKAKYMAGGPIVYPGKMDSVKILPGKNRVEVTGLFTSDPKIVKYRVFWNSRQDSLERPIKRTAGVDTAMVFIPNLPEGLMSFEIRTYDNLGNPSIPVFVAANVYGNLYQGSLTNRGVIKNGLNSNGFLTISWVDINNVDGLQNIRIKNIDNILNPIDTTIVSAIANFVTVLPGFSPGDYYSYRASYLPEPTAIDTFYVNYSSSENLLLNNGNNFTTDNSWYRWGNLTSWTTSDNVRNHWGHGGWAWDNGGRLMLETGWHWDWNWNYFNNIQNGKIYQAITLDPGTYTFTENIEVNQSVGMVNVVVAAGNGIPDIANISSAIASGTLENTNFQFTITQRQLVSIGILANIFGDHALVIKSFKLTHN